MLGLRSLAVRLILNNYWSAFVLHYYAPKQNRFIVDAFVVDIFNQDHKNKNVKEWHTRLPANPSANIDFSKKMEVKSEYYAEEHIRMNAARDLQTF